MDLFLNKAVDTMASNQERLIVLAVVRRGIESEETTRLERSLLKKMRDMLLTDDLFDLLLVQFNGETTAAAKGDQNACDLLLQSSEEKVEISKEFLLWTTCEEVQYYVQCFLENTVMNGAPPAEASVQSYARFLCGVAVLLSLCKSTTGSKVADPHPNQGVSWDGKTLTWTRPTWVASFDLVQFQQDLPNQLRWTANVGITTFIGANLVKSAATRNVMIPVVNEWIKRIFSK